MTTRECDHCGTAWDDARPSRSAEECPECGRHPDAVATDGGESTVDPAITITVEIAVHADGDVTVDARSDR